MENSIEKQLNRIDLNLLIALSVLLKEKNVSKAADVLFLTQSAMSKTLKRLRVLFDDELLIRSANKMQTTVKGEQLRQKLPLLLDSLTNFMQEDEFDPLTCEMSFSLSVPASMNQAVLLPLLQTLAIEAPKIRVTEFPVRVDPYHMLENDDIDFAVHFAESADLNFTITPLGHYSIAIYAGKHHPLNQKSNISYEDCLNYNFIAMNHGGSPGTTVSSAIHEILNDPAYKQKLVFQSSELLLITELLATTDSLYIGPDLLLNVKSLEQRICPVFQFEGKGHNLPILLIDHKRTANSLAHQWLKKKIVEQFG